MANPFATHSLETGDGGAHDGRIRINVEQISQDDAHMTSQVRVQGIMENHNDRTVSHDGGQTVERHIEGFSSYYPSDFDFNIKPNGQLVYIEHTFTVPHDLDGTQHVNFAVHWGITDTPTFGHDQLVWVGLDLTPFNPAGGAWVRVKGDWVHAYFHVRYKGQWYIAKPYVRTGGVWKPVQ